MRVNITEGVQGLGPEGAKDEAKSGLQGRLRGSRSLMFSLRPKRIRGRGRGRGRGRLGTSERLRGRRNERSSTRFSSKSLPRYLVFVLQSSSSSSSSCCCRTGENLDEASYNKLALMGFQPWVPCHAKMRPESGARMKRSARMISIRYGAPDYGPLQGTSP